MLQQVASVAVRYASFSGSSLRIVVGDTNGRRVVAMGISPANVEITVERRQSA